MRLPTECTPADRKRSGGTASIAGKPRRGTTSPPDNGPGAAQRPRVTCAATRCWRDPQAPGAADGVEWRGPDTRTASHSGARLPTSLQDASRAHPSEERYRRKLERRAFPVDTLRRNSPIAPCNGDGHRIRYPGGVSSASTRNGTPRRRKKRRTPERRTRRRAHKEVRKTRNVGRQPRSNRDAEQGSRPQRPPVISARRAMWGRKKTTSAGRSGASARRQTRSTKTA